MKEDGGGDGENQFRLLADNAPVMIWRADTTKACDFFNEPWLRFTGRTIEQEMGFGWAEGVHPDDFDRCLEIYKEAFDARREFSMDYRLRRHDGAYRWLLDNGRPFFSANGSFSGYFGSCIDIHDRKEAEEWLKATLDERGRLLQEKEALLREKEGLIQEVHHRTRNNMQLIVSLLRLQVRDAAEEERSSLEEAVMRVRSIALTLDCAHRSSDFTQVRLGSYLEQLAEVVEQQVPLPDAAIRSEVNGVADFEIPLGVAVPLGLILTELLSCAAQHGGSSKAVMLSACDQPKGTIRVTVAGRSADCDSDGTAFGMRLVRRLATQIDAALEENGNAGVTLVLPAGMASAVPADQLS